MPWWPFFIVWLAGYSLQSIGYKCSLERTVDSKLIDRFKGFTRFGAELIQIHIPRRLAIGIPTVPQVAQKFRRIPS